MTPRRLIVPGTAVAAVALTALLGAVVTPRPTPAPVAPPVDGRSTSVCPAVPDRTTTVSVVAGADARAGGEVSVRRLDGTEAARVRPGGADDVTADAPTVVSADGAVSARTGAAAVASGPGRGTLSAVTCAPAVGHGWLVGVRSDDDHPAGLLLTNPDRAQVRVNLRVHDGTGLHALAGGRDIVVPGQSTQVVALAGLYTSDTPLAVEIDAGRGRVAAVATQGLRTADRPAGEDVWPLTTEPAVEQVLPGIPGGTGRRELTVANPGDRRTDVTVEALGPDGGYVPAGAEPVSVGPGATAAVALGEGWDDTQMSLRIRADEPVLAGFASVAAGDVAVQPAAAPLGPVAVAPVAATTDDGVLALANPGPEAVTVLVTVRRGSRTAPRQVTLRAGTSQALTIDQGPASVEVETPAGSRVHGGVVLRGRTGVAAVPLLSPAGGVEGVVPDHDPRLG